MEVIDGQSLSKRHVTHETKALNITIEMHTSKVAFNVISSPTNPIVIGLSWFILHNLQMDWRTKKFHFDVPHKVTSKCEKPTTKNIINEGKNYHLDKSCTKCDKYLGSAQDVKSLKSLFIGTIVFMQVAKKRNAFLIYALPASNVELSHHEIFSQYKEFKDVFEKKSIDILWEHRPYDYTIDLEEGTQPPFRSIYNLSQDELVALCEYINGNFEKRFI
jgi:hypothetical protein